MSKRQLMNLIFYLAKNVKMTVDEFKISLIRTITFLAKLRVHIIVFNDIRAVSVIFNMLV
jgi:hypothetical protein